jgi:ribose transport system permease protein
VTGVEGNLPAGPVTPGSSAAAQQVSGADIRGSQPADSDPSGVIEPEVRSGLLAAARGSSAFWIGLVVIGIIVAFGLLTPNNAFVRPSNLLNVGLNASQIMLLALGMTFLIGAGHLDLSVGYNLILCSVLGAKTMVALGGTTDQVAAGQYPNLWLALIGGALVGIGAGALFGMLNGLIVTRLKLNSFIATLATSGIFYGVALILTSAANVPFLPNELQTYFGSHRLFGLIPLPLLLTLIVAAVLWWVMRATRFGMRTLALGSSREATVRAGIAVDRHVLRLFVLQGTLVGLASLIDLARNASTNVVGHQTDNLQAISAVVLGGTSLFGGVASIGGTLLGSLIPVMMANGLVIMNVQPFYQFVAVGLILIIAVYLDQRRRSRLS